VNLSPVTQPFEANASGFLAALDEMSEALDRVADQIDEITEAAERMGETLSTAGDEMAAGDDAAAESAERLGEITDQVAEAMERQLAAIDELTGALDELAGTVGEVAASLAELRDSADETAGSLDAAAASTDEVAASTDAAAGAAVGLGAKGKLAFLAFGAGLVYAVVKAAEFQSQLVRLHTQAGVATKELGALGNGVLKLAGQVGFSPTSLLASLYHVESNFESLGITAPKALELVRIAAEGAQVGGADVVDVTNALTAAVASGIPGVQNYSQAMGALNSIVGAGDMTMQDLADALSTGVLAAVKGYGLSLRDVGAALDVFGDNNIRGAKAGTELRMAVQALATPVTTAGAELRALGLTTNTLADAMRHRGLMGALDLLQERFKRTGVTAKEQAQVITELFGKRAGIGLDVLMGEMDRLQSKYPALAKGAHDFGKAWEDTQKNIAQKWHDFTAGLEALAIKFGQVLMPAVSKALTYLDKFIAYLEKHPLLAKFAGALAALAVTMGLLGGAAAVLAPLMEAIVPAAIVAGVVALAIGLYEAYKHCKTFRDAVDDVGHALKDAWTAAVHAAGDVLRWFTSGPLAWVKQQLAVFSKFWRQNGQEIDQITKIVWDIVGSSIKGAWDMIWGILKVGLDILETVWKITWETIYNVVKTVWNVIATVVSAAIHIVLDTIAVVLDVMQGKWSDAWNNLKNIASVTLHAAITVIKDIAEGFWNLLFEAGKALIQGFINGIRSMFDAAVGAVESVARGVVSAFKGLLGMRSPSRVFEELGKFLMDGLVKGIEGSEAKVRDTMRKLARLLKDAFDDDLMSRETYSYLTRFLDRDNRRLDRLAREREAILHRIAEAKAYAASVTSSTESGAGLANLASVSSAASGGALYSGDILSNMQSSLQTIRKFADALRKLHRLGLDRNLLNQIVQMGPVQGLQVADALLDGPVSVIRQMDQTQALIGGASRDLGRQTASYMYDTGKATGRGFLDGLRSQEREIERVMERIARALVATIRRELGIRSPSTVMRYHGQMAAQGFALGIDDEEARVAASAQRLTAALGGGSRSAGGEAAPGSGGTQIGPINITVQGYIGSQTELASKLYDLLQHATLQHNRRNGTNGLSLSAGRPG
jgi:TP901 family phage tail tape measure protein